MKNTYEKPIVELSNSAAEGVYAASGGLICNSIKLNHDYRNYKASDTTKTTVGEYYGCWGCGLNRGIGQDGLERWHCALDPEADFERSGQAGSYATGTNMPNWELMNPSLECETPVAGYEQSYW